MPVNPIGDYGGNDTKFVNKIPHNPNNNDFTRYRFGFFAIQFNPIPGNLGLVKSNGPNRYLVKSGNSGVDNPTIAIFPRI